MMDTASRVRADRGQSASPSGGRVASLTRGRASTENVSGIRRYIALAPKAAVRAVFASPGGSNCVTRRAQRRGCAVSVRSVASGRQAKRTGA